MTLSIAARSVAGRGPHALFAHGTGFHGNVWRAVAEGLRDEISGVLMDFRGHGASPPPPRGPDAFAWHGLAQDALMVVDALALRHPYGVGHSSGATALLLAELARPGTFRAIHCFEPVVVPADPPLGPDPDSWLATGARRRRDHFASRKDATDHYALRPPFSRWAPEVLTAFVDDGVEDLADGTVRLRCRPEHEARFHEMATAHDCFPRLREIGCPVMVACGDAADGLGPRSHEAVAERLPQGSFEVLAGLTHFGPMEDPGAVAMSLRRFLDGLGRGDGAAGRSGSTWRRGRW